MPRVNPEIDVQLLLGLRQPPIAIGFLQSVPAGLPRWDGPALAAGCGFWPQAMAGRSFYTLASDHLIVRWAAIPTGLNCRPSALANWGRPSD